MDPTIKRWGARALESVIGRRNMVRSARSLLDHARFDASNDMDSNGELLVLDRAIRGVERRAPFVAFDVGARVGDWSARLIPLARARELELQLHLFEPTTQSFRALRGALPTPPHVTAVLNHSGLSSEPGVATIHQPAEGAGTSSLYAQSSALYSSAAASEEVVLTTLDDYCSEKDVPRIDLLKLDVEGHEISVLEGATRALDKQAIAVVQFEYNRPWIHARRFLGDAFDILKPRGYQLGKVTPRGIEVYDRWHPELETFRLANFLAVREDSKQLFPTVRWWFE